MSDQTVCLTDNMWAMVYDEQFRWKTHICPKSLVVGLIADLTERDPAVKLEVQPRSKPVMIDLPGMMWMDRGYQIIKIDTLELSIPYHDFGTLYEIWNTRNYQERKFCDGSPYYKIHNYNICLVLSPSQYSLLMKTMAELIETCEKLAEEEHERILKHLESKRGNPA